MEMTRTGKGRIPWPQELPTWCLFPSSSLPVTEDAGLSQALTLPLSLLPWRQALLGDYRYHRIGI